MPWIVNVKLDDIVTGRHRSPGKNAMLIQIIDPDMDCPVPAQSFNEIYQFRFFDSESDDAEVKEYLKITDVQAAGLVDCLQKALDNNMNVVVHCVMGICRSGAVAEVGTMMGFEDLEVLRIPNIRVKHKMMKVLGWTYDSEEPSDWRAKVDQYFQQRLQED